MRTSSMCRAIIRSMPAIVIFLPSPGGADAYLDPGTGSVILQAGIAVFVGGLFAVKIFWSRIRAFFRNVLPGSTRHDIAED